MTHKKHDRLLLVGAEQDRSYLAHLKGSIGAASCAVVLQAPTTFYELKQLAEAKKATGVISTSPALLAKFLEASWPGGRRKPSIDNYAGSLFTHGDLEAVFIPPLEQLVTVAYGKFLASHYISKLTAPKEWLPHVPFNWSIYDGTQDPEALLSLFSTAVAIATDIETFPNPPTIRCVGYTALFESGGKWTSKSIVIPCNSEFNLAVIRQINNLPVPKIFQNGKYDISYLQAYNAAPVQYYWDTVEMFHSWYAELPKDLASLQSFFVRNSMYWKDLAETSDLQQYYRYNALDTWATALVFLAWLWKAPKWAKGNYLNTFPLQYPCHLSEMIGIRRDLGAMESARTEITTLMEARKARLNTMLGTTNFNVASPPQMKTLLKVLGCGDLESADEKNLQKAALRHPINARIINEIVGLPTASTVEEFGIRGLRKLKSTYLRTDADITAQNKRGGKEFHGHFRNKQPRILYALNPHGTDTGRLASKEHHFWCGLQIQNIPRGVTVKRTLVADDGFTLGECDLEQAESRDTAHISGDQHLIDAVSGTRDFHSTNASAFFAVPYASIYDDVKKKTKDKPLRDLAKRVNHGANYNMGPGVLVDTMGLDKIWEAQRLLKLPKFWTPKQVAEHLLSQFHKTYPKIATTFYAGVIHEIRTTKMLESKASHDCPYQASRQGLVRYCFGNPEKNKRDLNAYVAHVPQSLNSQTLNRAYMRVFYEVALVYPEDFKLLAQIHDSILFQVRKGKEHLAELVKTMMEIPVTIKGYDGIVRTFTVPAALKMGADGKGAANWGDTE